jgi:hypothetical protein
MRAVLKKLLFFSVVIPLVCCALLLGAMVSSNNSEAAGVWLMVLTFQIIGLGPIIIVGLLFAIIAAPDNRVQQFSKVRSIAALIILGITILSPFYFIKNNERNNTTPPAQAAAMLKSACSNKAINQIYETVDNVDSLGILDPHFIDKQNTKFEPEIGVPMHFFDKLEDTWLNRADGRPSFKNAYLIATVTYEYEMKKVRGLEYLSKDQKYPVSGWGRVPKGTEFPRYILTWKNIQTPEENKAWIVGVESTILDSTSNKILAKRISYYLRAENSVSYFGTKMLDGCDGAVKFRKERKVEFIRDSYDWVTSVLKPSI